MLRARTLLGMLAVALLMGGWLHGEDAKDNPKLKGQLPANWGKLGLSDEQKQKVYKVQADYKEKIADLEKQLKDAKAKEKQEMEAVLTDEQKKRLRDLLTSKAPDDKKDKKDDKKDDKK
jgi:Spy/CpxP family protein refolding chaperone